MATVHPVPWIVESPQAPEGDCSASGLVELMLKDRARLDELMREESRQAELIPRFLAIALASYALFALAMIIILSAASPAATPASACCTWARKSSSLNCTSRSPAFTAW